MKRPGVLLVGVLAVSAQVSNAQTFNAGIATGWTVAGTAGTSGANGVVTLAPTVGSTAYGWVSTYNSSATGGYGLGCETNGSTLTSNPFNAFAGDALQFYFNYVTSDGGGFADYGYANLLNASDGSIAAVLFTARTEVTGTIAPGAGLPAPVASLNPGTVPIQPGAPTWAFLGSDSGTCYAAGCGFTGWVQSTYGISADGSYRLQFGVTNWTDTKFASAMAFDGITVAGVPITPAPEPRTLALILTGLAALGALEKRRRPAPA